MAEPSLAASLWWIIPGKLGGLRKPLPEEVADLKALGVGAIVSVMDDPSNLDLYEQAGIPYLWLPTTGGTAPSQAQIEQFIQFVDAQSALSSSVVVHCSSGRRRTGTMLAAYLIAQGKAAEAAISTLLQANPQVELREAQTQFLHQLEHSLH